MLISQQWHLTALLINAIVNRLEACEVSPDERSVWLNEHAPVMRVKAPACRATRERWNAEAEAHCNHDR